MSEIEFACPGCGRRFAVPASQAGRYGGCSHCGARFPIPNVSLPLPAEPATPHAMPTPAPRPADAPPFVVVEPTPASAPTPTGSGSWSWLWIVIVALGALGRIGSNCNSTPNWRDDLRDRPAPKIPKIPRPGDWAHPEISQRLSFSRGNLNIGGILVTSPDHRGQALPVVLWFGPSNGNTIESPLQMALQGFAVVVPDHWACPQEHLMLWCEELAKVPSLDGSRLHAVGYRQAAASIWAFVQNPNCPLRSAAIMPAPQLSTDGSPTGTPIPVLLFVPPNTGDANVKATVGRASVEISPVRFDPSDPLKPITDAARFFREQGPR